MNQIYREDFEFEDEGLSSKHPWWVAGGNFVPLPKLNPIDQMIGWKINTNFQQETHSPIYTYDWINKLT